MAWQVRFLDRANWWTGWAQVESEEAAKHMVGRYEALGQKAEYRALHATPPATIPVEALEGLVRDLREGGNFHEPTDDFLRGMRAGRRHAADELTQLIKERSNG